MFKLARQRVVLWPVRYSFATDDGVQEADFRVRFRLWTPAEARADALMQLDQQAAYSRILFGKLKPTSADEAIAAVEQEVTLANSAAGEIARLRADVIERVSDWEGIVDDDKAPIPFSRELLEQVLDADGNALEGFVAALREASKPHGALAKN